MYCPKCREPMEENHAGCPENTLERWSCPGCAYSFEMRSSSRGFNYCFEQEEDLAYERPAASAPPADNGWGFPHRVFEREASMPWARRAG